jgi:hypothetical protein
MASAVVANDVGGPLPAQPTLLYIPDFLDAMVEGAEETLNCDMIHKDLLLKDWIIPGLSTEIQSLFPTADQIDKSTASRDLARSIQDQVFATLSPRQNFCLPQAG